MLPVATLRGEIAMKPIRRILVGIKNADATSLPALTKAAQMARPLTKCRGPNE